ncbi:YbaB/EbfC family nucleoid-associated protein [Nocardia sp. alder85J]|uniref:YbaB/EbfC family nucleoid-associated protein n=1 Tax=Nocardia sp. alder85J TaxID=2862949 RepID=UPI001CD65599|nr:YbaB/EbfC family nucleoid-associated protein [Nocardia sp. alder85J]MCX4093070.1 YbaB/EbfC family nucleoid-associated protein [Nocardia sp. alder85J]
MSDNEFAAKIEQFREQADEIGRLQEARTRLMGVGTAERRRVTVTVNADGIVIDIKFSSDIGDLEYDEIATAITEASRLAVADVAGQTTALFAPIAVESTGRVGLTETLADIDALRDQLH